jgi:hypothetical protein
VHWHLGKIAPWFYATCVFLGVLFMGRFVPDTLGKMFFAMIWFAATPLYLYFAMREIIAHIRLYGFLDIDEVSRQTRDPFILWIGDGLAVVVWGFGIVGNWTWPTFTWVEWLVIAVTVLVGAIEMLTIIPLLLAYQAAVAAQKRFEEAEGQHRPST